MSKIAVIGLNGVLGSHALTALKSDAFASKVSFPVLAVTRDPSKYTSDEHVKYVGGDYSNPDALAEQLKGVDVLVSVVGVNPELFQSLEKLVAAVKPKLYIPSQFGVDIDNALEVFPGFLGLKKQHSDAVRKNGQKVVDVSTSLFAQEGAFLYEVTQHIGADPQSKKALYLGSPDQKFSFTHVADIGRVIASLATHSSPLDIPDKVRVQSGLLTPKQVVEKYEQSHNVKFETETVSKEDAYKQAQEVWAKGFDPSKFLYYLNVLVSQGEEKGVYFTTTTNELVNPGESLWKWESF